MLWPWGSVKSESGLREKERTCSPRELKALTFLAWTEERLIWGQ